MLKKLGNKLKKAVVANNGTRNKKSLFSSKQANYLSTISRYQPGEIKTKKGIIKFVDACTLIAGNKEIFIDETYKFCPKSDSPFIIDCGANIGLATLYFKQVWPNAEVIAIEPDPSIFNCLNDNINNFGCDQGVITKRAAVWTHSNGVEFDVEGGFSGQIKSHGHSNVKTTITVPSIQLKELIANTSKVDLLKIDIEGAEFEVLKDISITLEKVDNIFIEYHSHQKEEQKLDHILHILKENSFRYHITDAYTVSQPFVNRKTMLGMDLQLNIYGYRY